MTKEEYLSQLKKYLKKLPQQDYNDAIEYFAEYFEESNKESGTDDQQLINELGTPKEAARELIANLLDKRVEEQKNRSEQPKSHVVWIACLSVLSAPMGVPLLTALILILLSAFLCIVLAVFCAFLLAGSALTFGGTLFVRGIIAIPFSVSGATFIMGTGLLGIGIGILTGLGSIEICKGIRLVFIKLARNMVRGKKA